MAISPLAYAEAEVIRSRSGTNGVVEEDVQGVVAVSFSHWASRSDDPQLHDHLLVWARARCSSDGRWRTLDSRALYKAVTTLSELYDGALADLLTGALEVGWEERERRHSTRARFEMAGVPEALLAEFSQRAGQVAAHAAELRASSPPPTPGAHRRRGHAPAPGGHPGHPPGQVPRQPPRTDRGVAGASRPACTKSAPGGLGDQPGRAQRPALADLRRPGRGHPGRRRPGRAGHWPGWTTRLPSCTPGSNVGPPLPPADTRLVPASSPGSSPERWASATKTWPERWWDETGPWSAGPGTGRTGGGRGAGLAQSLGPAPVEAGRRDAWLQAVSTVAAFRDRWELGPDPRPLGLESAVTTLEGLGHRRGAQAAVARALKLANATAPPSARSVADPKAYTTRFTNLPGT